MLLTWILVSLFLTLAYIYYIRHYLKNWKALKPWDIPEGFTSTTSISVIIPIRNEAGKIGPCIESILNNDYPADLLEIIIINDHSSDASISEIESLRSELVKIIDLSTHKKPGHFRSHKKWGISKAVDLAEGSLILCTDGDCVVPKEWLNYFSSYYELTKKEFIAGPVNFIPGSTPLQNFQELDMMGVMIMTGAGFESGNGLLCNGANMAFAKSLFISLNGYEGSEHLSSGDDVFLLHKTAEQFPEKIGFIKNKACTVYTASKKNWSSFLNQRLRWATKTSHYQDIFLKISLTLIFLFHLLLLINVLLLPFFFRSLIFLFLLQLAVKLIADRRILSTAVEFFRGQKTIPHFLQAETIQIAYLILIGFKSIFKKDYEWKGRRTV